MLFVLFLQKSKKKKRKKKEYCVNLTDISHKITEQIWNSIVIISIIFRHFI